MSIEIVQDGAGTTGTAALVDDQSGARIMHAAANSRVLTSLMFSLSRTAPGAPTGLGGDTSVTLPGGAIPVALRMWGAANDSTTGATVSVGLDNVTSNHFLSSYNVANAPTGSGQQVPQAVTNLFAALPLMPRGQSHNIIGRYAVAGTSSSGGPWYFELDYYLPNPA